MDIHRYIAADPQVCHGKPCFKGTRIMVATVLELLESGKDLQEIRKGYSSLQREHIRAALHLAHQLVERQGPFIPFK